MKQLSINILMLTLYGLVLSSCSQYENTDLIVGKWELINVKNFKADPGFIWEFNADETYTITNPEGSYENDPDDSNPLRDKGVYTGMYNIDAPAGLTIREKYRPPYFYSAVEIDGNKMSMQFIEEDYVSKPGELTQYIKLTFEKVK
jgi:hypothetical protein